MAKASTLQDARDQAKPRTPAAAALTIVPLGVSLLLPALALVLAVPAAADCTLDARGNCDEWEPPCQEEPCEGGCLVNAGVCSNRWGGGTCDANAGQCIQGGDCPVNLEFCNGGRCLVNLGYCQWGDCTVNVDDCGGNDYYENANSTCTVNLDHCNYVCGGGDGCSGGKCTVNDGFCWGGECEVNFGDCSRGRCDVNLGECNWGSDCDVNLGTCETSGWCRVQWPWDECFRNGPLASPCYYLLYSGIFTVPHCNVYLEVEPPLPRSDPL